MNQQTNEKKWQKEMMPVAEHSFIPEYKRGYCEGYLDACKKRQEEIDRLEEEYHHADIQNIKLIQSLKDELKFKDALINRAYVFIDYNRSVLSPIMLAWCDDVEKERETQAKRKVEV
jgi:hypothetical protein